MSHVSGSVDVAAHRGVNVHIVGSAHHVGTDLLVVLANVGVLGSVHVLAHVVANVVVFDADVTSAGVAEGAGGLKILQVGDLVVDACGSVRDAVVGWAAEVSSGLGGLRQAGKC